MIVRALDMIAALIVARFLTPADFGIVALATAALAITRAMTELPVSEALVRNPDLDQADIDTAFTLSVLRGVLIAILLAAFAWPMAYIYEDDRLIALMLVLSLAPMAQGFRNPRMVYFARDINFAPTTIIETGAKMLAFVGSVVFAYFTQSYWALIIALVVPPMISTPASYLVAKYRPRFNLEKTRSIISYAGWVTLSRFISTANVETDRFLLGAILGKADLGFWAMGRSLAYTVGWSIGIPLMQSMFSGFSRVQNDRARLLRGYLKGQAVLIALVMPIGFGVGVLAEPLILLALGRQWLPVAPIITFLAPAGALGVISMPVQSTMLALNRPKMLFFRDGIMFIVGLPAVVFGAMTYGIMGAVVARTITAIASTFVNLHVLKLELGIPIWRQLIVSWRSMVSIVVMVAVMVPTMAMVSPSLWGEWQALAVLLITTAVGGSIYVTTHALLWLVAGKPAGPEAMAWAVLKRVTRTFSQGAQAR